jgi:hypothetical protein
MQETRENFNNLSIYGKVVGKPEYFDGIMSFSLYQEGNNLFMHVVSTKEVSIKQGQILDVRGKLTFDAEDEVLILQANTIIPVEQAPKHSPESVKKKEQSVIQEPAVEISSPAIEVEEVTPTVSIETAIQTEDKVVSVDIPTIEVKPETPVSVSTPVSTPVPTPEPVVPPSVKEESSFKLFKVSDSVPETPVSSVAKEVVPPKEPAKIVTTEDVGIEPTTKDTEEDGGYSLNDFHC